MIKVTALTANRVDPSSRFRIRQFIEPLTHFGINVTEHYLPLTRYRRQPLASLATLLRLPGVAASQAADITWFRRELIPERLTLERFAGGRKLFDVDDAIWLLSDSGFSERIVAGCDGVIAGNRWLAEHYEGFAKQVWVVPTSVDTDRWRPATKESKRRWTIGWIGTNSNLKFLQRLEEPLAEFLTKHSDCELLVVCDRRPTFAKVPAGSWEFVRWSEANEVGLLQKMDVGLMPLEDSDWARGKCGFKMLSYMAVGLPVVVSPVGVNQAILAHDELGLAASANAEWYEALDRLYNNRGLGARLGRAGRRVVEENYSVRTNVVRLAEIFNQVAGVRQ